MTTTKTRTTARALLLLRDALGRFMKIRALRPARRPVRRPRRSTPMAVQLALF